MIPLIDDHYSYVVVRSLYFSPDIPRPTKYDKSVLSRWPPQPFFLSSAASVAWLYKPAERDEFWELPQKHLRYLEIKIRPRLEAAKQHQAIQKSAKIIPVLNAHLGFNMIQHSAPWPKQSTWGPYPIIAAVSDAAGAGQSGGPFASRSDLMGFQGSRPWLFHLDLGMLKPLGISWD